MHASFNAYDPKNNCLRLRNLKCHAAILNDWMLFRLFLCSFHFILYFYLYKNDRICKFSLQVDIKVNRKVHTVVINNIVLYVNYARLTINESNPNFIIFQLRDKMLNTLTPLTRINLLKNFKYD